MAGYPDIDSSYPFTAGQASSFEDRGYIHLRNVLGARTLATLAPTVTRRTFEANCNVTPMHERGTYGRAFLQAMNLWEVDDGIRQFVMGRRLARIAAELLGVAGVRLYHDQSLYKEPGGDITPAHADQYYWPIDTDRTVTAWIPLQPVPAEMGPLAFYPGSHRIAVGRDVGISDESEREIAAAMERAGLLLDAQPFDLGDVSFHLGWTFHRAGPNQTDVPRSVMTIIYMDQAAKLSRAMNRHQEADARKWCPGLVAGDTIATPKNPVLCHHDVLAHRS